MSRQWIGLSAVVVLTAGLIGCQTSGLHAENQGTVPAESSAELVQYISDQANLTAEPAYRATHVLAEGVPFDGTYDELRSTMIAADLICDCWDHEPNEYVRRGDVGYMVCEAVQIRTGLNWNTTKLGRYAYRELVYHGIAEEAGEHGLISGGEFVGILSRAEDYMARNNRRDVSTTNLSEPRE